ncbi:SDR family NAD(P)-dependent oxidoreductase [Mucilaginibacter sp. KACC 22063]|uniref:SDR family NAD(P)-dependent oxidoreductase n=1 Tax=Mucilaginibacter sp. KACC 22063 TaxID=3025666 RepID=UPI002365F4CD|nr:SDR family NAD(P)-dependent oxidoreductase [Mucilaginibacter sp. KACC 22063]WDF56468.1 SDR family NAD(P)-dependent oxidoreductase [Mucilaginibacter sp. KACC 22063]
MNIIITGASSGVGFEAALELINKDENHVIALARQQNKLSRLQEIATSLNPGCTIYPVVFDLVNDDYDGLKQFIEQKFGGHVDILINNAGALINKPFEQTDEGDFVEMLQSNFLAHIRMTQAMLPYIKAGGHIVNIGSMGGVQGSAKFAGLSAYSASKAALHNFTETLANELTDRKISVNCLALGSAQTEMLEQAFPGYESPVMAFEMGKYIADFSLTGHKFFNGKILPVAVTTP